jgi:hypothetical protein
LSVVVSNCHKTRVYIADEGGKVTPKGSDFLADVKAEEYAKITTDGVIEIVRDEGDRPEADLLLGSKRRISTKAGKPLLIILFAAELVT